VTDRIDREALAGRVREVDARPEFASTVEGARHAVELLIGTDRLRQAVDDFVADDLARTSDLIEGVLRATQPPSSPPTVGIPSAGRRPRLGRGTVLVDRGEPERSMVLIIRDREPERLAAEVAPHVPRSVLGRRVTRCERERILG
jgi:hypothetical protein